MPALAAVVRFGMGRHPKASTIAGIELIDPALSVSLNRSSPPRTKNPPLFQSLAIKTGSAVLSTLYRDGGGKIEGLPLLRIWPRGEAERGLAGPVRAAHGIAHDGG